MAVDEDLLEDIVQSETGHLLQIFIRYLGPKFHFYLPTTPYSKPC